ncbi:MAG: alanine:cation symporter family protein [Ruminococcaceae bacterium]|nr:alanine:cation symporter family protein [Oscillospiraceae bacterium]
MVSFVEALTNFNNSVNSFVWGKGLYLLLATGLIMTVITGVFQITHIGHWFSQTIGKIFDKKVSGHVQGKSISQFQALCTALAATVGVGNIAGVAAAIVGGGPGAVFWMWIAAFFGMMTNYSENVLGIYYRRKNADGEWSGGAMYYLRDGLGNFKGCRWIGKVLAVLFSIFAILASFGIGAMGQINKIVVNVVDAFQIPSLEAMPFGDVTMYHLIIGIVLVVIAGLIILGGLKRIANFAEKVVPFMVVLFVLGSLIIIGINYSIIGAAFASIFKYAFTGPAVWGGVTGIAVKEIVTLGCKRGVFSNEAGLGSSVMVHSNSNVVEPVRQGLWGIFEVFADTMVVCTMTALVVLTSGVINLDTGALMQGATDANLVAKAFSILFGVWGERFIAIAILLFAFTTVLGWDHYGTKAWEYLFGTKATKIYKVIHLVMIFCGALLTSSLAWDISDTFNGLMMVPNLIGVLVLSGLVVKITRNYIDRNLKNKDIKPMLSAFPEVQEEEEKQLAE